MTGLFDFVSYGVGLTRTSWRTFLPALVISVLISNPPIIALGAGILDGGRKLVFLALVGIFALSVISNKLNKKSTEVIEN